MSETFRQGGPTYVGSYMREQALENRVKELEAAVMRAFGWLWHVQVEPGTPGCEPRKAATEARKELSAMLTHQQKGQGIEATTAAVNELKSVGLYWEGFGAISSNRAGELVGENAALRLRVKKAEAELAAQRANTWQPIETAPKGGFEILGWREDAGVMLIEWTAPLYFLPEEEVAKLDSDCSEQEDWFYADLRGGGRLEGDCLPTHWMPLPPGPSAALAQEGT